MPSPLAAALPEIRAFTPEAFAHLGAHVKPEWFFEALAAGPGGEEGQAQMRRRKLPVDRALWLAIGMGLFRDRSIQEVVQHLDLALVRPGPRSGVAKSAIPQARQRLGVEPVQHLFELTGQAWGHASAEKDRWRGLSLYGLDGVCLRVADTPQNEAAFGRPGSARGGAGYPQVRMVGLMALRSHVLAGLSVGGINQSEHALVEPLWERIPDHSLSILDRNFLSWGPLYRLHQGGQERHWLLRTKSNLKWTTLQKLGPGDERVEIKTPKRLRGECPDMPETIQARVVKYQVKGYRPQRLITSMLDPERFPASELAALYHERWEIELGYDELKTHMLEREEALRSKQPEGVRQEIAGIAIAYNLVRKEMERVAQELNLPSIRISFRHALMLIRNFCLAAWATSPGVLPSRLGELDSELRLLVLPERRPERRYKRHVKVKMSNFPRNRGKSAPAA
jgi:hypothetical protein